MYQQTADYWNGERLWPLWPQHQREWYRSHTCTTLLHLQSRDNDNTWIQISTVMHYSSSTDHHWLDTWRLWTSSKKSLKVCLGPFLCPGTHFTGFLAVPCTFSAQSLSQLFLFPCQVFTQATQRPKSLTTCTVPTWPILLPFSPATLPQSDAPSILKPC